MAALFEGTYSTVESAMRFRVARQALLATNVANADTPGYRRVDLEFSSRFDAALAATGSGAASKVTRDRSPGRLDGNNVNLDRELVQLSRNAGAFSEQAAVLSRLVEMRRVAIGDR